MGFTIFLFAVAALIGYGAHSIDKWGEEQKRLKAEAEAKAKQTEAEA